MEIQDDATRNKVAMIMARDKRMTTDKEPWNIHYQVIAETFQTRKSDFTVNFQQGQFLNKDLFDMSGPTYSDIAAGAFSGMLWPEGGRNFEIVPTHNIPDTEENKNYFDRISLNLHSAMNNPECGLSLAVIETMRELVNFGTGGVGVFEPQDVTVSKSCHFLFQPWDVKRMKIYENAHGYVNIIHFEREDTIENFAVEFGKENLSQASQRALTNKSGKETKIKILQAIYPRYDRDPDGLGVFNMSMASCYIELGENHLIKESGFDGTPVFVCRFLKNVGEKYGRSLAMNALSDALELNALREMGIMATEKDLDPPLGVLDDGRLGATTVDTSPNGITVFNISGRIGNQPPVFPIIPQINQRSAKERILELTESISNAFLIDRLLDVNNETEMTLGEVIERQKIRAFVLNPYYVRPTNEIFSPLIHKCFQMELERGYLGVFPGSAEHKKAMLFGDPVLVIPPDIAAAMLRGEEVYDIKYLTPAARMMKMQLASGILNVWKFTNDVAAARPMAYDNLDEDISTRLISEYYGAPTEILRSKGKMVEIRQQRDQQMAADDQFKKAVEMAKATKGSQLPGVESAAAASPINL